MSSTVSLRASVLLLPAAALLLACSTMRVDSERGPGADLSSYRTYSWMIGAAQSPGSIPMNLEALDSIVREVTARELEAAGFRYAGDATPDFLVWTQVGVLDDTRVSAVHRDAAGSTVSRPVHYQRGTLAIELVDAGTGELAWRGWAEANVLQRAPREERRARIDEAVTRILERLP